mmetsp:Transcript_15552/g.42945  ORF Transcript_15552/g.42945 Transcript_15552/m.42945 type:complete len:207 (+) Transcript_15552:474-1094(+)
MMMRHIFANATGLIIRAQEQFSHKRRPQSPLLPGKVRVVIFRVVHVVQFPKQGHLFGVGHVGSHHHGRVGIGQVGERIVIVPHNGHAGGVQDLIALFGKVIGTQGIFQRKAKLVPTRQYRLGAVPVRFAIAVKELFARHVATGLISQIRFLVVQALAVTGNVKRTLVALHQPTHKGTADTAAIVVRKHAVFRRGGITGKRGGRSQQ